MSEISKKIKELRLKYNITMDDLAEKIGKNRATIYRYENGDIENLPTSIIEPLAKALHTTPGYLMGWEEEVKSIEAIPITKVKVPILGTVACGQPIFAEEHLECYVDAIGNIHPDFALWARGDSMIEARIYDGDLIFVKKQEIVENGEIAVVLIDDEVTLKKVLYEPEKGRLMLMPANKNYLPLIYEGEELNKIRILGKAVAFQSNLWGHND